MGATARGDRRIVGITGAPGAGKTTYAVGMVAGSDVPAAYLPMDGFHHADVTLTELGRLDRKGAPDTFDAWGYAALLARLRTETDHAVYAPGFERDLEQPVAAAVTVPSETAVVVTEGNYLLLDRPEWRAVRAKLYDVLFVVAYEVLGRGRVVARHVMFGKTRAGAEAWVARVDDANAALVAATRDRADRVVEIA